MKHKWLKHLRPLWGLPLLLALVYVGKVASDGYVSHATAVIKSAGLPSAPTRGLMSFLNVRSAGVKDLYLIQKYLMSRDVFLKVFDELALNKHFSDPQVDWFSRLNPKAPNEVKYRYFSKKLKIKIDENNNTLDIAVATFDPLLSNQVMARLLSFGEDFINQMDRTLLQDKLSVAQIMVDSAEQQLREMHQAILRFQSENQTLSPTGESSNRMQIINALEQSLSKAYAELRQLKKLYKASAPKVRAKMHEVEALKAQLKSERAGSTNGDGKTINRLTVDYETLKLEEQLAREKYNSALAVLEAAHKEMGTSYKRLLVLSPPTLPDYPEQPKRLQLAIAWVMGYLMLIGAMKLFMKASHTG